MTLATAFLAATLAVPSMPPPEYDDCEVITNCVFDASRDDAKVFAVLRGDELRNNTSQRSGRPFQWGEWKSPLGCATC